MEEVILEWQNSVLKNYLEKNGKFSLSQTDIDHIEDWMKSGDADRFQTRMKRISVPQALEHAEKWVVKLNKKAELLEAENGVEEVYSFSDKFRIVKILTSGAYGREGAMMGHCVASYYGKKNIDIFSLRDPDNNPHCTIELYKNSYETGIINQIKGKKNKKVLPEFQHYVVEFLKKSGIDIDYINESDARNVGAYVVGENQIFSYTHGKDLIIELEGNIEWGKSLEYQKIRPHILKVSGDFSLTNYETLSTHALVDEIHIGGNLKIENVDVLQRLANRVYVDGNVEVLNCLEFLKLGTEVYIGGHADFADCPELKMVANTGLIQKALMVVDCEKINKKPTIEVIGKVSIY